MLPIVAMPRHTRRGMRRNTGWTLGRGARRGAWPVSLSDLGFELAPGDTIRVYFGAAVTGG